MTEIVDAAREAHAGLSIVPPRQDGSKRPVGDGWQRWQAERPNTEQVESWYGAGSQLTGLGAVCGTVSGNLELFEFDDREAYEQFKATAADVGLGDLVERIEAGYLEETPGGGIHWLMRSEAVSGNTVLARRPRRPEEKRSERDAMQVLVETRGEGGYAILAPSRGGVHPTGRPYVRLRGSFATIPVLTAGERAALWDLARTFDQTPDAIPAETKALGQSSVGLIDDVNARMTWDEILGSRGWTAVSTRGGVTYWRRPGKDRGWSAVSGYDERDLFCCYSTSAGLKTGVGFSKFGLLAELEHAGDFKAAAAALGRRGFGPPPAARKPSPDDALDEVPPFPTDELPLALRDLVTEGAAALVAPADFIAVPLLVAAGVAIGDALELELKPGWTEGPNLYAAIVGDPGAKKTPTSRLALDPLHRIQDALRREYGERKAAYERALAAWEGAQKSERGPRPAPPVFGHVVTTDATTEALAAMLQTAKGMVLFRDELTGWVRAMDQYRGGGKGSDRQHFLSMWSRSPIKVDRKSSPEPIVVPRPMLSVFGGIQPDLLPELADAAQREDGFVDRLLWAFPDPVPDRWTTNEVRPETLQNVRRLFDRLQALEAGQNEDGEPAPRVVRLSEGARERWVAWYGSHAAEMSDDGFQRRLRGPWAKLPGQLARLILILHAVVSDDPVAPVHEGTVGAAIVVLDYFKCHARRAYRQLHRQRADRVVTLLAALKRDGPMNQRAILHDVFQRNVSAEWVRATLEELEESGLVTRSQQRGETGRPATIWAAA